ncbi:hypothetical protein [Microbacterium murale]|uniref:Uncharacterized protein n=1 Tax=Microbacterium murale TaxID=1081040 RepID=A0ABU0P5T5_9MICO|nr:hypothetical protein [Microbacterium murale]MDQ0642327.1 hypothetical protein [Microbacterium murale]
MSDQTSPEPERQRIVRVPGSRRARLTPAPGTDPSPEVATNPAREKKIGRDAGPNDARMQEDVPPHY